MLNLGVRKISWVRLLNKFKIFAEKLAFQAHQKSLHLKCWLLGYISPAGIVLCEFWLLRMLLQTDRISIGAWSRQPAISGGVWSTLFVFFYYYFHSKGSVPGTGKAICFG